MKHKISAHGLDALIEMLDNDFKEAHQSFQDSGGKENCIADCRLYGQMEYIHNKIERINREFKTRYSVPQLPYSPR
ncbi:MAG: hypothetical protein Q8Q42_01135 [Nanoarchaeota archaeon]|nr:hypothetical protein [Nanoarchaeota archaeon]